MGAASIRAFARTYTASGTTNTTSKPTGTIAGDYLVAFSWCDNDGSAAALTAPTGTGGGTWSQLSSSADTVATTSGFGKIFTCTATSSEPTSYTFGVPNATTTSASVVVIYAVTGQNQSNPISASPVWSRPTPAAATALIAPTVTLGSAGMLFCRWMLEGILAAGTITPPAGMTGTSSQSGDGFITELFASQVLGAGATGTRTATASNSGGSNTQGYLTVSMGIADAPVPPMFLRRRRAAWPIRRAAPLATAPAHGGSVPVVTVGRAGVVPPAAVRRRTRATPAPEQLPVPKATITRRRPWTRRGRPVAQAPVPQVAPIAPAWVARWSRPRRVLPRRRPVVATAPVQQVAPIAPAWVPQLVRARRVLGRRRPVQAQTPLQQTAAVVNPAWVPILVRYKRTTGRRRPVQVQPVPAQTAVIAPPGPVQPVLTRRRAAAVPRRRGASAPIDQAGAPAAAAVRRRPWIRRVRPSAAQAPVQQVAPVAPAFVPRGTGPRLFRGVLARRGRAALAPAVQAAPVPPAYVPQAQGRRRVAAVLRRGRAVAPAPAQDAPPAGGIRRIRSPLAAAVLRRHPAVPVHGQPRPPLAQHQARRPVAPRRLQRKVSPSAPIPQATVTAPAPRPVGRRRFVRVLARLRLQAHAPWIGLAPPLTPGTIVSQPVQPAGPRAASVPYGSIVSRPGNAAGPTSAVGPAQPQIVSEPNQGPGPRAS